MVQEKHGVQLSPQKNGRLRRVVRGDRSSAQAITRARILLKTDEGWSAALVATALNIWERALFCAKSRYAEEGLDEVHRHRNQVNRYQKVRDRIEAHLMALACSPAPKVMTTGRCGHWRSGWGELGLWNTCPTTRYGCVWRSFSSRDGSNGGASPR